jgi:hypothetical protein
MLGDLDRCAQFNVHYAQNAPPVCQPVPVQDCEARRQRLVDGPRSATLHETVFRDEILEQVQRGPGGPPCDPLAGRSAAVLT